MAKSLVNGTMGIDDIHAVYNDPNGSNVNGYGGDDILRGGSKDDVLTGGQGNDQLFGGAGKDVFRFFGDDIVSLGNTVTGNETDSIRDMNFTEGDQIWLEKFSEVTANGKIKSFAEIVALVDNSHWYASDINGNENLKLTYNFGEGKIQNIIITVAPSAHEATAQAQYEAAYLAAHETLVGAYSVDGQWNGGEGFALGLLT
jgi:hypothetical protein